ncbi:MAG: DUF58 domain-containing protein [Planctomycetaceae bacterium]|nr:MAG: DUF58 domain-containing protein [Planctomycetaceae bacterium]
MPQKSDKSLTQILSREFIARLDSLDVLSRKIFQGKLQGERRSKRRGQSVEFADHRPYAVGDDLRSIDWNTYARLDQLFLKLFMEEQDLTVHVVLDASASMAEGEPTKDSAVRKLAAALSYVALVNNNRLTMSAFADGLSAQAANLRGRNHVHRIADFLLSSPPAGETNFERACKQLEADRVGSGVMIVLSDFFFKEGFEAGMKRLASPRYDLYAIQILSPQELEPSLTGDVRLIDVEDGDAAEITVTPALLKFYKRNLASYCNDVKDFCTRRGGQYILTNSGESMENLVLNYLRRRGLLK